jgi:hypothetical protein
VITIFGLSGVLFANFSGSLETIERDTMAEVGTYLLQAIQHPENIATNGNLISVRKMDMDVYNSFAT